MKNRTWLYISFVFILLLVTGAVFVDIPKGPNIFGKEIKVHQGLDLKGGAYLLYELDLSKIDQANKNDAIASTVNVIRRRIDGLGVSEPSIQSTTISGKEAIIVELPGITNIDQAISLIGKTAQLQFMELPADQAAAVNNPEAVSGFVPTGLTGADLVSAKAEFQSGSSSGVASANPDVALKFNGNGSKLFKDITKKNLQKPVAIVLDGEIISAPTVQSEIDNGQAVITGNFTIEEAKNLAVELNAGALPVPIKLAQQKNIGATLGSDSVKKSVVAGLIGTALLALFMLIYYRFLGLVAIVALAIYAMIVLALFKLIPVTMTLAGIAGFILSVGMAVDANVLIFERMKEELRGGRDIEGALNEGFRRAWNSIRDSNISTIITCLILFWLGTGIVRGFALTLGIGTLVSMFSAITVTRTLLRLIAIPGWGKKLIKFV